MLSDGGTVHVRPIRPDDAEAVDALHHRLSADTVYFRFFSPLPSLAPTMLERFTHVDYVDRMALVAELGQQLVAVARYDRLPGQDEAEVAFVVEDPHQGRGIATLLLEHLAAVAKEAGIRRFVAETLPENRRMLGVFTDAGFAVERAFRDGVIRVAFAIEPTPASVEAMHGREHRAAARSVARLLAPRTVALVGAGRRPATVGHTMLRNLLAGAFNGPVYPVNRHAHHVAGIRAWPSVRDIPDEVDLAVIAVPAAEVVDVVNDCAAKRVSGLVVISAGFSDRGDAGRAAERELVLLARRHGMRLIGPNSMGVINTDDRIRLNASIATAPPPEGRVGIMAQSGALGVTLVEEAQRRQLGVSTFVSAGNKADVSGNDLIQYWEDDPATDVVLLYLESFGNPRTFSRVARRVSRRKPIVAVKGGRGEDTAVDALFRATGVIRVPTLDQLFDTAQALAHQPLPAGRAVAIVSNGHSPAVLARDACAAAGLSVAPLAPATQDRLAREVPGATSVANPVDLAPRASAADYEAALAAVLGDAGIDAVLAVFAPPLLVQADAVATAIAQAAANARDSGDGARAKPVLANFLGQRGVPQALRAGPVAIPSYAFPEGAVLALSRMAGYAEWRDRPEGSFPDVAGFDPDAVRMALTDALAAGGRALNREEITGLLKAMGLTWPETTGADGGDGVEMEMAVRPDPAFGPLVEFASGGVMGQLFADRAYRAAPLTDVDAAELARAPRGARLLLGFDGRPPLDIDAATDGLVRLGRVADEIPELTDLWLDVVVGRAGVTVRAARASAAPYDPHPEQAVRRLR